MLQKHKIKLIQLLLFIIAVNLAFGFSNLILFGKFWKDGNAYPSLLLVIIFTSIVVFFITKQFKINSNTQLFQIITNIFEFIYISIFFVLTYWFIINAPKYYKSGILLFFLFSFILLVIFNKLLINYLRKTRNEEVPSNNCIVIENSKYGEEFKKLILKNDWMGFNLINTRIKNLEDINSIISTIIDSKINTVFIDLDSVVIDDTTESKFKEFTEKNMITVNGISNIYGKKLMAGTYNLIDNVPYIQLFTYPLDFPFNQLLKRFFDIFFSLMVIIFILSWLFPIISILIILESGFPIIYKQKRGGNKQNEFNCLKFRSMKKNKDADKKAASRNDSRVTKFGKFLRKSSLDEMPQFFNVLVGDMSIVGPRPHMLKHDKMFSEYVSKYLLRHYVKPGITGLAQIKGYRGEIENNNDIETRILYDVFYVKNWSFLLDMNIIFNTIKNIIIGDKKAY